MAQSFHLREQTERRRRLARESTDATLRDGRLKLAEEYAVRANAQENDEARVWQAGPEDQDD